MNNPSQDPAQNAGALAHPEASGSAEGLTTRLRALDDWLRHYEQDANADADMSGDVHAVVNVTQARVMLRQAWGVWDATREAIEALGAMPEGYCFCSTNRIGDDSKHHEPECRDLRAALAKAHQKDESRG
jgi:hypothetical protein